MRRSSPTWFGTLVQSDPERARRVLAERLEQAGNFSRAAMLLGVTHRHLQRLVYLLRAWDLVEEHRARMRALYPPAPSWHDARQMTLTTLAIKMATNQAEAASMLRRAFAAAGDAPGAVDRVAKALGVGRRSIYRYDKVLVEAGLLKQSLLPQGPRPGARLK